MFDLTHTAYPNAAFSVCLNVCLPVCSFCLSVYLSYCSVRQGVVQTLDFTPKKLTISPSAMEQGGNDEKKRFKEGKKYGIKRKFCSTFFLCDSFGLLSQVQTFSPLKAELLAMSVPRPGNGTSFYENILVKK